MPKTSLIRTSIFSYLSEVSYHVTKPPAEPRDCVTRLSWAVLTTNDKQFGAAPQRYNMGKTLICRPLFQNASRKISWWHIHWGRYCAAAIIVPLAVLNENLAKFACTLVMSHMLSQKQKATDDSIFTDMSYTIARTSHANFLILAHSLTLV